MRFLTILLFTLCCLPAIAQKQSGIGLKGGLNFGSSGDFTREIGEAVENPDSKLGYHIGAYGKINISVFYLRPELIYTKLNSDYTLGELEVQKIDAPILLGLNVIGPLHVFAGPSLQYIINSEIKDIQIDEVMEEFSVGAQLGLGVNIGSLGIDLRYERGFKDNEIEFTGIDSGRIDTRPEQLIVALSVSL